MDKARGLGKGERRSAMKYVVIDDCTKKGGFVDDMVLDTTNGVEAIKSAELAWSRLTAHDQKRRDAYYLLRIADEEYDHADDEVWVGELGVVIWSAV